MAYKIRNNWISSFGFIRKNNIILLPFIFIAFFEALVLEVLYFSARSPLSFLAGPIIRKFFGEQFTHYPEGALLMPNLFYYAQIVVYVFAGALLTAISINIFKNLKTNLPVKTDALIKNALKRYLAFFCYGVIYIVLMILLKNFSTFTFLHIIRLITKYLPIVAKLYFIGLTIFLFLLNIILQVFLVLTLPIIVIQKKSLLKSILTSVVMGFKNFGTIFILIFLPFLVYLPVTLLKSGALQVAAKTFPEMNLLIILIGIVLALFADCFIYTSVSQFLMDKEEAFKK